MSSNVTDDSDEDDGVHRSVVKLDIVMFILGVITTIFYIFSAYLIYKVFKLIRFTDKPQLLSVIGIFLSLNCKFILFKIYSFTYSHYMLHDKHIE